MWAGTAPDERHFDASAGETFDRTAPFTSFIEQSTP
jgi:hypothetical protein